MSTTSTKPQIFINRVDLTISEETISKACEEICSNKPTSITLRPSHDKKNNLCVITLSNETEAETLLKAGSITVNNITLKIEEYQAQFPNLFLKNTNNLITAQELQEGLKDLIKGNFHVYYGSGYVSFFIQDQEELTKLVNQTVDIKGKPCTFEKYVVSSAKKEKTHLFLRFSALYKDEITKKLLEQLTKQSIPLVSFSSKEPKNGYFTISIIFQESKDAEQLFKDIEDEKHILFGQTVNVSWKKPDEVEQEDKFIIIKWLNSDVTEETLKKAFSQYGEILSIEMQTVVTKQQIRKFATVQMSSSEACVEAMSKACSNFAIKNLFFNQRVQVSPYFSKAQQDQLTKATQPQVNIPLSIDQTQLVQTNLNQGNYQFPQQQQMSQLPQQFQMMPMTSQFDQNTYFQFLQMQQAMYQNNGSNYRKQYNNNYHQNNNNSNYRQQDRNTNNQTQKGEENKNQYETGNNNYGNNQQNNQRKNKNFNHRPQQQQQYQQYHPQQGSQGVNPKAQTHGQNQQAIYQKQSQQGHQQMTLQQMQEQAKNPEKFKELVLPRLNDLIHKELKDRYPEQMSQQTQIFEMLTDSEVLTNEEVVNFLYQSKELKERIDEAIALILTPN